VRVSIYINEQRLDLFEDETISLNQSVKDLKDLTKVFNDFSNNFTVPATSNNNIIFKNYYDVDIDGGFDARIKQPARIDLDGFDFRAGKIQLTSVDHKKGLPVNYKIQYFSNLTSLKDLFGDDKLGDLEYLDNYNHEYTDANVESGFLNGLTLNGDTAAIVYPLISYDRRFVYNMATPPDNAVDISSTGDGVDWTELLPAIRCHSILRAIKEQYGLEFSNEFFDSLEFQQLYMSLINSADSPLGGIEQEIAFFEEVPFFSSNLLQSRIRVILDVATGFENVDYLIRVYKNEEQIVEIPNTGDFSLEFIIPSPSDELADISIRIFTNEALDFDTTNCRYRVNNPFGTDPFTETDDRTNIEIDDFTINVNQLMPDMKVIDWFNAIKQAFNLVVIPEGENEFYVNDLNSWYVEGRIYDISEYVDTETKETKRGKLYRRVDMNFESNESFLAYFFNEQNKRQYGSLQEDVLINGEKIDGDVLEIKLPFEKPLFERLSDIGGGGGLTEIMYGFITDKSQENFNNKPFLFYAPTYQRPAGQLVKFNKTSTSVSRNFNITPSSRRIIQSPSFAVNFGSEINEFDGVINTESFYNTYWRDYINDTMSIKRREINIKAKFPQDLIFKLQPNDRLIINGIRYVINSNKFNLLTGESSLSLFNDIFEFATPLDITGNFADPNEILLSYLGQTTETVVYSRDAVKGITTEAGWITFDDEAFEAGVPFIISVSENETEDNRQGDVIFEFDGGNVTVTIAQLADET